ncbi:MAG TPA: hypothetical protein VF244_10700 [Acidimicrobiales bacterium]
MRRAAVVLLVLAVSLAGCGENDDDDDDTAPPPPALCDQVAFTPNSEDAASDIRATGIACGEAEALVRAIGHLTSSGGGQPVTVGGFRCVVVGHQEDPLPRSTYQCVAGARTITFVRS